MDACLKSSLPNNCTCLIAKLIRGVQPRSDGYLAIIRPHDKFGPKALAKLISWDDWEQEHNKAVTQEHEDSEVVKEEQVDCASGTTAQVDPK